MNAMRLQPSIAGPSNPDESRFEHLTPSRGPVLLAVIGVLLAMTTAPDVAHAHVSVTPSQVTPESNQTFTVRVPTEKDEPTVKVRVEFPASLTVSRFQPKPGWTRQVERDNQQRISAVTWSGGQIGAGEYEDFALIARTPREVGQLAFKAYQTYQSGETVEWINPEGRDQPAAFVQVQEGAAAPPGAAGAPSVEGPGAAQAPASPAGGQETVRPTAGPAGPSGIAPAQATGSDLPLLASLGALVIALIALVLATVALARRPRAA
jgi:uncharacterized protein YcnI